MSTSKFNLSLENARLLSDKFGIVPLLYGSLGLEYLTGDDLGADDIDILVPHGRYQGARSGRRSLSVAVA